MKKLTTIIAAMAAVLLTGACNKAEVEHEGSAVTLDYTVSLAEAATKAAIGDGTTVDQMVYAIFDEKGLVKSETVGKNGDRFSFSPALYYGQTYTIALFAYKDGAYKVDNITEITRTQNGEAADAFSYTETIKITQDGISINGETPVANTTRDVTLVRPVAQLAIGTENSDFENFGVTSVEVTVEDYDVASYNAKGNKCNKAEASDLTYELKASYFTSNDPFMVGSNAYRYVSVNYLFPTEGVSTEVLKTVVITLKKGSNLVRTIELPNVPLVANKKTQIYGNLVKGEITFNVSINNDFSTEGEDITVQQ